MKIFDLPTPALVADADRIAENQRRMNEILRGKRIRLRPHYKSHKCAALAQRQIASGAIGMTCAKLSEAEDLIFSGVSDVLIANQVVEPAKIGRLAQLAGMCNLTVCVDDAENANALSRAAVYEGTEIHCLAEYDIGMKRCGVRTPEEYLALAKTVVNLPNLSYDGIQAYAGYASHMVSAAEREAATRENESRVAELTGLLRRNGIEVSTVSGGSTGTAEIKAKGAVYTELQAGSYLFMDSTYSELDLPFRNSLFVLSTVVSRSGGAVILDTGVKGLGADQNAPVILDRTGKRIGGRCVLNEEHLKLYDSGWDARIGEKAFIIPGHCCSTVNLYDNLYLYSGEIITERLPVTARGKSQ
ncbi:MAG: DSD1 family PLP-dependent enzyme [Clostridiales bacterium]|nr:DSD1 family PLP-dependent enzyme [Clostridiales bacterium]